MRAFVVGTAGHVDHGKTALVRALTGVETDRWEEERERGLTIDLGFAPLEVDADAEVGVVDVPGHEDFVTNMLAGATGIDLLLLVVAADEGPMPQTREHLTIARLLGVRRGLVALTKIDRVEEAWLELAEDAVREELRTVLGHDDWPIFRVSSTEAEGVEEVRREIGRRAGDLEGRPPADLFRLPVDRSFSVRGAGTVVTGTAWSGTVAVGDEVRLLPLDRRVRVRSLEVHGQERDRVPAGRRCALALVGVEPDEVPRGSVAVEGEAWRPVESLGVRLRLPGHVERRIEDGQRIRIYLGTREVMARADLPVEAVDPGGTTAARLRLEDPLVARARDRFVVRFYSPVTTLGGGRVAELSPDGDWPDRTGTWDEVLDGDPATALRASARMARGRGLPDAEAPIHTGLPGDRLRDLAGETPEGLVRIEGRFFDEERLAELRAGLLDELARMHRERRRATGASLEALRRSAGGDWAEAAVDRSLDRLEAEGDIVVDGPAVRLPDHRPSLTEEERALKRGLLEALEEGGLEPPTVDDLEAELGGDAELLHELLDLLVEEGELVRVDPEIYLPPGRAEELAERGRAVLERTTPAGASDFKEELGVTRKYLIPYLQHLDRQGLTRRTPEGRVPAGGRTEGEA